MPAKTVQTKLRNPFKILRELDAHQWRMFFAGWLGWTWDAFDFFTVSLTVTEIAAEFGVSDSDVTWVGASLLGLLVADSPPGFDRHSDASLCRRAHLRCNQRPLWPEVADDH